MAEKCVLCNNKVEEIFLGKFNGTTVRVSKNTSTGRAYVCRECQIEHGDKLKEIVNK